MLLSSYACVYIYIERERNKFSAIFYFPITFFLFGVLRNIMWLLIKFPGLSVPLLSVVGRDSNLYFSTLKLGEALGYKNKYAFARRRHTRDLKDLVPATYVLYLSNGFRFVAGFQDVMQAIRSSCRHHNLPTLQIHSLQYHWCYGYVRPSCYPEDVRECFSPRTAFELEILTQEQRDGGGGGEMFLQDWLRIFAQDVLSKFPQGDEDLTANIPPPPSVESNFSQQERRREDDDEEEVIEEPKQSSALSVSVKAEGIWTIKSSETFQKIIEGMRCSFQELEKEFETNREDQGYELQLKLYKQQQQY